MKQEINKVKLLQDYSFTELETILYGPLNKYSWKQGDIASVSPEGDAIRPFSLSFLIREGVAEPVFDEEPTS